jgi:hypothetical protein
MRVHARALWVEGRRMRACASQRHGRACAAAPAGAAHFCARVPRTAARMSSNREAVFATRMALTTYKLKAQGATKGACRRARARVGTQRLVAVLLPRASLTAASPCRLRAPLPPCPAPGAGYDLLKKKSDALTVRLRGILREIKAVSGAPRRAVCTRTPPQRARGA